MLARRTPGDQTSTLHVDRQPGVGHQRLERGEERLGADRRAGTVDRVRLESRLVLGRPRRLDLLQRLLDRCVFIRPRPHQQAVGVRLQHEVHVREQILHHNQDTARIGRLDRIGHQLLLLFGPFLLELLDNVGQQKVLGRLGPDGQLVGLFIGDDLDARQLFGQSGHEGLKPLLLGGGDRVHDQLVRLFRRRAGFKLLDRRLDDLVIRRRGHRHHAIILRVQRDLCLGDQLLKDRDQVVGRLLHQRMETQHGRIWAGSLRLQLLQRGLDRLLIGRYRQCDQAVGLRIDTQLSIG